MVLLTKRPTEPATTSQNYIITALREGDQHIDSKEENKVNHHKSI